MDMEQIVSLCKRRGFVFQSSEIYGGLNGFWDYGPLGVELKRNIKNAWWQDMVLAHDDLNVLPGAPGLYSMTGIDLEVQRSLRLVHRQDGRLQGVQGAISGGPHPGYPLPYQAEQDGGPARQVQLDRAARL